MYNLVGVNGNAYSIMGYVAAAMRNEGRSEEEITGRLSPEASTGRRSMLHSPFMDS